MLQFRDIKQNSSVYILDKTNIAVKNGKITSASFPKMEFNPQTSQQQMMITFGIEVEGKSSTYAIPESSSTVDAGDLVISTEKTGLLHELENMNNAADQFLNSVDNLIERNKTIKEKTAELLSELNPVFKEKQETEKRFAGIEQRFGKVEENVNSMKSMLEDFIKKMG